MKHEQSLFWKLSSFFVVGIICAVVQVAILSYLESGLIWHLWLANPASFLLATQLNFLLSHQLTWRNQSLDSKLHQLWWKFNFSRIGTFVIQFLLFTPLVYIFNLHGGIASVMSTVLISLVNYRISDRRVFLQEERRR